MSDGRPQPGELIRARYLDGGKPFTVRVDGYGDFHWNNSRFGLVQELGPRGVEWRRIELLENLSRKKAA